MGVDTVLPTAGGSPRHCESLVAASHPDLPGFERLSDEIWISRHSASSVSRPDSHPRYILLFGWGDVIPKHIRKYSDGLAVLFPATPQIILTTRIKRCLWTTKDSRAETMRPILDQVYPPDLLQDDNVLVQTMSDTSIVFYAATLHLYEKRHGIPMPHRLLIFDSTPGNAVFSPRKVAIWGAAMALRMSKRYKLPFIIGHGFCVSVFCVNHIVELAKGQEPFAIGAYRALTDSTLVPSCTRRLYLYGRDDSVVTESEIERHIAQTGQHGLDMDYVKFEGSNHVSHMRHHPEKYWAAIADCWHRPVASNCSKR